MKKHRFQVGVVGLGYVGLPLAIHASSNFPTIGFDVNEKRVEQLNANIDVNKEEEILDACNGKLKFTSEQSDLESCNFYIVAVPTPVDSANSPDLSPIQRACEIIGPYLKSGDAVIFESTVYPGCTEGFCLPILRRLAGSGIQFSVGYSPERVNPGDRCHTIDKIVKVIAASDDRTLALMDEFYSSISKVGIFRAESIVVAEAAKVVENVQRDVNIALMNELAEIFHSIGVRPEKVFQAAETKWNFLKFTPGLVGGHCIGVDPYYLLHINKVKGIAAPLIETARFVNEKTCNYLAELLIGKLKKPIREAKVAICGFTFKEDVNDFRNSKSFDLRDIFLRSGAEVFCVDPFWNLEQLSENDGASYQLDINQIGVQFDLIVRVLSHSVRTFDLGDLEKRLLSGGLIYDVKSASFFFIGFQIVDGDKIYVSILKNFVFLANWVAPKTLFLFGVALLLGTFGIFCELQSLYYFAQIASWIDSRPVLPTNWSSPIVLFSVSFVSAVSLRFISSWLIYKVAFKMGAEINFEILRSLDGLRAKIFEGKLDFDLKALLTIQSNLLVQNFFINFSAIVQGILMFFGLLLFSVFAFSWELCFVVSAIIVFYLIAQLLLRNYIFGVGRNIAIYSSKFSQLISNYISNLDEITVLGKSDIFSQRGFASDTKLKNAQVLNMVLAQCPKFVLEVGGGLALLALVIFAGWETGKVVSAVGLVFFFAQRFLPVFQQSYAGWSKALSTYYLVGNVRAVLREGLYLQPNGKTNSVLQGPIQRIGLKNFLIKTNGVDSEAPFLRVDDIEFFSRQLHSVVGISGSGKSTLLKSLASLFDWLDPHLTINGCLIDRHSLSLARKHIYYMPQKSDLFAATIKENLTIGCDTDPTDMELYENLEAVGLKARVEILDGGLNHFVPFENSPFSGGEIQRMTLLRACMASCEILLLDEPTSALDAVSRVRVIKFLKKISGSKLVVVATHDPELIEASNHVYLCENQTLKVIK